MELSLGFLFCFLGLPIHLYASGNAILTIRVLQNVLKCGIMMPLALFLLLKAALLIYVFL